MTGYFPQLFTGAGPRVFTIPPGAPFAQTLVEGLRARLPPDAPPELLARIEIFAPTRRALRTIGDAFAAFVPPVSGSPVSGPDAGSLGAENVVTFLPRLRALGDLGLNGLGLNGLEYPNGAAPPPAIDPLRRELALTALTTRFLRREPGLGPAAAAPALARDLATLLDQMQAEGVDFGALGGVGAGIGGEHAAHWGATVQFLSIIGEAWPRILAEEGAIDPEARRRVVVDALIAHWAAAPPPTPMIAAGSTGSNPASADLLAAIAHAPQGAVILPGFNPDLDGDTHRTAGPEHPQYGLLKLIGKIGVAPTQVALWSDRPASRAARRALIDQALRPAPVTDAWRAKADRLAPLTIEAVRDLTLIEADGPRREAAAIALMLREALETPGKTAALVTPDRSLARRVSAELIRWGIEADDSGGRPLSLTPPGVFLILLARAMVGRFDPVDLLALLKHPLCAGGIARTAHLEKTRRLERIALRGLRPEPGFAGLRRALTAYAARPSNRAETRRAEAAEVRLWLDGFETLLQPLAELVARREIELTDLAAAHLDAAEALSRTGDDVSDDNGDGSLPAPLWRGAAGQEMRDLADRLRVHAPICGAVRPADYPTLLRAAMAGEAMRESVRTHPRIAIWGPLEVRMQSADLLILGGLNDRVWPRLPDPDPWLSRDMREAIGLPTPERRIGLSAHDFTQAAAAPEVALTRSLKVDGAPTTASRWLLRLTNLLGGLGEDGRGALASMRARGGRYLALADTVHRPEGPPAPAPRPRPRPPVDARPRELPVTAIQNLIRDPYAVYARYVLRLRALDPIAQEPNHRERGTITHRIVERFNRTATDRPPEETAALFASLCAEELDILGDRPALRALWAARLARTAPWLLNFEAKRRETAPPIALEARGRRDLETPGGTFTLTAKADRIDRRRDGAYAICDYKTGAPPSDKRVREYDKQMPLEAAIATAGGFEGLAPGAVAELLYIRLSGRDEGGAAVPLKNVPELISDSWSGLRELIAAYDLEAQGYGARLRPAMITHTGDYDHLARVGEWDPLSPEEPI